MFLTKRWVQIPRGEEPPEPVYLAKVPDLGEKRDGEEVVVATTTRRRAPPPPPPKKKKKGPGRKSKKVVFEEAAAAAASAGVPEPPKTAVSDTPTIDVEMADAVDPATKEESVPINDVAKEIEKAEEETEKASLVQHTEELRNGEALHHALPGDAGAVDIPKPEEPTAAPTSTV